MLCVAMQIVDVGHAAGLGVFEGLWLTRAGLYGEKASREQHRSQSPCDFSSHTQTTARIWRRCKPADLTSERKSATLKTRTFSSGRAAVKKGAQPSGKRPDQQGGAARGYALRCQGQREETLMRADRDDHLMGGAVDVGYFPDAGERYCSKRQYQHWMAGTSTSPFIHVCITRSP
jgi:hypothetical protein